MIQYLYNEHGQFIQKLEGTAQEILAQIPEGFDTTILPPPRTTDYFDGSNWVNIGPAPHWYLQFDYAQKTWFDTRSVDAVRQEKWNQIKLQRNQIEFGGFEHDGCQFDSDQVSQGRILAAVVFGNPTTWTLADDTVLELTKEQLQALGQAMAEHIQSTHARGRLARKAIFEATTIAEVEAVLL